MRGMTQDYPKQMFVFYASEDIDDSTKSSIRQLVQELVSLKAWCVAPPAFVDETDEGGAEVIGGVVEVWSALPSSKLPIDLDSKNLEDVEALIEVVRKYSEIEGVSFEFLLDSTYVGSVDHGVLDRTLREGLLEPWRKNIVSQGHLG